MKEDRHVVRARSIDATVDFADELSKTLTEFNQLAEPGGFHPDSPKEVSMEFSRLVSQRRGASASGTPMDARRRATLTGKSIVGTFVPGSTSHRPRRCRTGLRNGP
jgi:hypothetical protein